MVCGQLGKLRQVREEALRNCPRACQQCVCFSMEVMEKPAARRFPGSSYSGCVGSIITASFLVRRIGLKVPRTMKTLGEFHPYAGHVRATLGECLHFPAIRTIAIIEGIVQSQLSWQLAPGFLAYDCHASSFPSIKSFQIVFFLPL